MAVAVNLCSDKKGELKRFLQNYFQKEIQLDEDVDQWIYVYHKPLHVIDIISAIMDNQDQYQILVKIQIGSGVLHRITIENHNEIIKGILGLFYQDSLEDVC